MRHRIILLAGVAMTIVACGAADGDERDSEDLEQREDAVVIVDLGCAAVAKCGDGNHNGKYDVGDIVVILDVINGGPQPACGYLDVNGNHDISIADAILVQRVVLGYDPPSKLHCSG